MMPRHDLLRVDFTALSAVVGRVVGRALTYRVGLAAGAGIALPALAVLYFGSRGGA
jgi:hypothetical protein